MAGKQYPVLLPFRRDDEEGNSTRYEPGDKFSGDADVVDAYLKGVDKNGNKFHISGQPLIGEPESRGNAPAANDDAPKEAK